MGLDPDAQGPFRTGLIRVWGWRHSGKKCEASGSVPQPKYFEGNGNREPDQKTGF